MANEVVLQVLKREGNGHQEASPQGASVTERLDLVRRALEDIFCLRHIGRDEILFRQGEPAKHIYYILRGRIVLERADEHGHSSILCMRKAGDFLCPLSLFDASGLHIGTARALEPSIVLIAPKERFVEAYQSYPVLWEWAHRQCFMQIHGLMDRLNMALHHTVEERLAWLLWREAQQWGADDKNEAMEIHLTQQELAAWIGATRETVSRILQRWKQKGWIQVRRGRLIVLQPQALKDLVDRKGEGAEE